MPKNKKHEDTAFIDCVYFNSVQILLITIVLSELITIILCLEEAIVLLCVVLFRTFIYRTTNEGFSRISEGASSVESFAIFSFEISSQKTSFQSQLVKR